jgi:hypothetical protein
MPKCDYLGDCKDREHAFRELHRWIDEDADPDDLELDGGEAEPLGQSP